MTAKEKIAKNYVFTGLGFPVVFDEVRLRSHGDDEYPVINSRKLQDTVFDLLIDTPVRLTGAQVAFIRKYMNMTQSEFAAALDLNGHGRVSQWEAAKDEVADIRPVYLAALRTQMARFRGRLNIATDFLARTVEGQLQEPQTVRLITAA